jgi:hypothetical protein
MSFALDLDRFMRKAEVKAERQMQRVVIVSFQGIITRTPVDTGRAKSNWRIAAGSKNLSTDENTNVAGNTSEQLSVAGSLSLKDQVVYISNNLPYAMPLEFGHSGQAPQGMVRVTALEVKSLIAAGRL